MHYFIFTTLKQMISIKFLAQLFYIVEIRCKNNITIVSTNLKNILFTSKDLSSYFVFSF